MAILITPETKIIVQGITGRMGRKHAALMRAYGTDIVGGTAPAGSKSADLKEVDGAPVFRSCAEAVKATGAVASVAMVPPFEVLAAISEAVAGGIKLIVTVTEGMPVADAIRARSLGTRGNSSKSPVRVLPAHLRIVSISRFVGPETSSNSNCPAVSLSSLMR